MALSYTEYKNFQELVLAGMRVAVEAAEGDGVVDFDIMLVPEVAAKAAEACGLQDRPADINSTKGFLGFMMMVSSYPEEFSADRDFWVECHVMGMRAFELIATSMPEKFVEVAHADPDVVMAKRFIVNPEMLIK